MSNDLNITTEAPAQVEVPLEPARQRPPVLGGALRSFFKGGHVSSKLAPRRTRTRGALTVGFAVIATTLALPASAAHADVTAQHADCRYSSTAVQYADRILDGYYTMRPWPEERLGTDLSWTENPLKDDSWQNTEHSLMWVLDLLQAEVIAAPEDHRYANRLYAIIKDWEATNPRPGAPSKWAWSDHSTARRAIVLACVNDVLQPSGENKTRIDRMLMKHGATLMEDGFYVKYGNHALDQSIALLEAGRVLGVDAFKNKAEERVNEYIGRSVDVQGVMNEQSVYYQQYNYKRYLTALDRFEDAGVEAGSNFDRVPRMPTFLAHATLPTGRYEMIGDTQDTPVWAIPGTVAEYAATSGASGPHPGRTVARFNAGYLFARSGWGRPGVRAATDETFFSTKWGPGPILHGHNDGMSVTLASWGSRLLVDSGLYRYGGGAFRNYMWSRQAHNVVTVDGATWNPKAGSGRVVDNTLVSDKYVDLKLQSAGYRGVSSTRRVTYSRALDYLIVEDRMVSSSPHTYRQLWHLDKNTNPVLIGTKVYTRQARGNLLIAQLYGRSAARIVKGSSSPIQGWTSYQVGQLTKTPAVEVIQKGRSVRYITMLVPTKNMPRPVLKSFRATSGGYDITVKLNGKTERMIVNGKRVGVYRVG